jgi:hypothetical protein
LLRVSRRRAEKAAKDRDRRKRKRDHRD